MLTVYEALSLANKLPDAKVTALTHAAAAVSLAELQLAKSREDADGAHQLWLVARRVRADSNDNGYPLGDRHTSSPEELRYEVIKCGAALMDARHEYAEAILAEAEATLRILCLSFGVGPQGAISNKPPTSSETKSAGIEQ